MYTPSTFYVKSAVARGTVFRKYAVPSRCPIKNITAVDSMDQGAYTDQIKSSYTDQNLVHGPKVRTGRGGKNHELFFKSLFQTLNSTFITILPKAQ